MTKIVHESKYVAEVVVDLIDTDERWSPYLSPEDAYKLDDVRKALHEGDTDSAARYGRVFRHSLLLPEDSKLLAESQTILHQGSCVTTRVSCGGG